MCVLCSISCSAGWTQLPRQKQPLALWPVACASPAAENEDDDFIRFEKGYRNLSLLVTTGPGPVPSLDGENIVVGQVTGESESMQQGAHVQALKPCNMPTAGGRGQAACAAPAELPTAALLLPELCAGAEGLDVIAAVTQVPTFQPNDNARAFNKFASLIGEGLLFVKPAPAA